MKASIYFLLFFLPVFGLRSNQSVKEDRDKSLVYWDDRDLEWKDFKGKTPKNSEFVALTHSAIKLTFGGEGTMLTFYIETVFHPESSWKTKNISNYILKHEQGHFDITEYHSRLLRKEVSELKFRKQENIGKDVEKLFRKHHEEAEKMQEAYDEDTNHSIDKDKQAEWDLKIAELLEETKEQRGTLVSLDIGYLLE